MSERRAGWYADPTGRHELRYWDGKVWTRHVSDDGVLSAEPGGYDCRVTDRGDPDR